MHDGVQAEWTALMMASSHGHKDVVEVLLAHNADVHVANKVSKV